MAVPTASNEAVIASTLWNAVAGLINGTSGYGQPFALTDMGSATWVTNNPTADASTLWALTVRNRGTGGQGLRVLSSSGSSLLTVQDSGVVFAGGLSLPTTTSVLESLETPLTNGLPVQGGDDYERIGVSEGSTSPAAETLAPMLNFQRQAAHNGISTTQASDYYFYSKRYGSCEQSNVQATSGTSNTITRSSATWTTNQFAGMQIDITAGTAVNDRKLILSNTATTITIDGTFSATPDNTSYFVVNKGGAYDLYALTCYAYDASTAKPGNTLHSTIAVSGFSKQAAGATGTAFGALFLGELDSTDGNAIGVEIDIVNNQASAAGTYPSSTKQTIGLNIASFGADNGAYAGTYNSLGILLQSSGPLGALRTGMLFGANSVLTYGIDFSPLTVGSTTPKVIRLGSGHAIAGRNAAGSADVSFLAWEIDDTLRLRSTNGTMFESNAGTEWARINSGGLSFAAAALVQTTTAAGLTLKTNSTTRMEFGSGATIGVFGVTPAARASAYTQTYATATRTHSNPTATALTAASGTADGTVDDVTAAHSQTILNNNFKEMATQINALIVDVANVKQVLNSVITDHKAYGWFQ